MPTFVDDMKGEMKSFTQIYNLVGLSIAVIVIVVLVYDVWILLKAAKIQVRFGALWWVIVNVRFHALLGLKG